MLEPSEGSTLADVTSGLGDKVGSLSPALGQTVRGTGATADVTIRSVLSGGTTAKPGP
jgi:hypothetical protein